MITLSDDPSTDHGECEHENVNNSVSDDERRDTTGN